MSTDSSFARVNVALLFVKGRLFTPSVPFFMKICPSVIVAVLASVPDGGAAFIVNVYDLFVYILYPVTVFLTVKTVVL